MKAWIIVALALLLAAAGCAPLPAATSPAAGITIEGAFARP
jgi:hypothetical protein